LDYAEGSISGYWELGRFQEFRDKLSKNGLGIWYEERRYVEAKSVLAYDSFTEAVNQSLLLFVRYCKP
jgi:hypothetical protein